MSLVSAPPPNPLLTNLHSHPSTTLPSFTTLLPYLLTYLNCKMNCTSGGTSPKLAAAIAIESSPISPSAHSPSCASEVLTVSRRIKCCPESPNHVLRS